MKLDTSEAQVPVLEVGQTVQADLFYGASQIIFFFKQTRSVATLHQASLSMPFFFNSICSFRVSGSQFVNSLGISNL